MEKQEEDWDMSMQISFQQAGSILATMGFLPENVTPEHADYKLFEDLWALMDGPANEGVKIDDLSYMLMVIRGSRESEREIDCQPDENKQGLSRVIIFDQDGNL